MHYGFLGCQFLRPVPSLVHVYWVQPICGIPITTSSRSTLWRIAHAINVKYIFISPPACFPSRRGETNVPLPRFPRPWYYKQNASSSPHAIFQECVLLFAYLRIAPHSSLLRMRLAQPLPVHYMCLLTSLLSISNVDLTIAPVLL